MSVKEREIVVVNGAQEKKNAKKKILFLTVPMAGHSVHTARLVDWFLQYPDDYEVNVGAHASVFPEMAEGIIQHVIPEPEGTTMKEQMATVLLKAATEGTSWIHSQALMLQELDPSAIVDMTIWACDKVDELKPDVVVCDHSYNLLNCFYAYCKQKSVALVRIVSMGRTEVVLQPCNLMKLVCFHFGAMRKFMAVMPGHEAKLAKRVPKPWPKEGSDEPISLFPSTQELVEEAPAPFEVYVGPFLPLPGLVEEDTNTRRSLRRQSTFNQALSENVELAEFLARDVTTPIVYLALGTLVMPSPELIKRLHAGLSAGKWRVIWALPKEQQEHLPKVADGDGQFFITHFAPQYALLRSGRIGAFLSHCGANSTMECLSQGVPMICMPFMGDQWQWAVSICNKAVAGVIVDKFKSSAQDITAATQKVLEMKIYRTNAQAIGKNMLDGAKLRLDWLSDHWDAEKVKAQKNTKVGIPVAAGIIDAAANGKDALKRLPPRPAARCCG